MHLARRDFFKASVATGAIAAVGVPAMATAPAAGHVAYCSETGLSWWDPTGAASPCRLRMNPASTGAQHDPWA
jgi:hypothetical protein